ncbi:MAG: hypothetical protein LBJ22_04970 [Synergistaceae bacterium]|nr:hypothetical protein [Synergistaceae bacterium]
MNTAVGDAVQCLEGKTGEAILFSARNGAKAIVSETTEAIGGLIEELKGISEAAKETALDAKISIHNEWVHWVGLLVLVGLMVSAVAFLAVSRITASLRWEVGELRQEIKDLEAQAAIEQEMLDKMRSETWGVQLFEKDGIRFILLKAGDRLESYEKDKTAVIRYVIGEGENRREAVKVLP